MENNLGKKIRELRRARDMTQEQLADCLNVSYQSVSKWETGVATPDLSFIIPLARLFGISTDALLGFEQSKEELLKKEYLDAYEETWKSGDLEKRLEICRSAVREYPGDMQWMTRLAMALDMHCFSYEDNERYQAERAQAIQCYKIVIENATDEKLRENAIAAIVQQLSYAGRKEEAMEYALLYPEEKRDEIEQYYLEGEELIKHKQKLLKKEYGHLLSKLNYFFDEYHLQIAVGIIKLFFPDENYLDKHYILFVYELTNSKKALKEERSSDALAHLKKAKHHAAEMDKIEFDAPGEYRYTAPLFDKLTVDTSTFLHTNDGPALKELAKQLENPEFDVLRSDDRFQDLICSL
ncbi:MAG: helix-turn-helix transcriptional regulator [Clostridia bacterium]|nr:helix-turn-helix transcriptional regulator [Clostridia bacterium]